MATLWKVCSIKKRRTCFRVNPLKSSLKEIQSQLDTHHISYTLLEFPKDCFLLETDFTESDLWKLDIYQEGKIYIQGISSQIAPHIFSPKQAPKILDACAAPGGKTSQLAALYPDGEIWAFEPSKIRYEKMQHNLNKLWCQNVHTVHDRVENISQYIALKEYFDIILIDAPCSGEGSLNYYNRKFLEHWSLSHIKKNYHRQKQICESILPYLKVWGEIIYSTCTLAPEENEGLIHYLLCHHPEILLESIDFPENKYIKYRQALKNFEKQCYRSEIAQKAIRVVPSQYSEWFFIAKFKKNRWQTDK